MRHPGIFLRSLVTQSPVAQGLGRSRSQLFELLFVLISWISLIRFLEYSNWVMWAEVWPQQSYEFLSRLFVDTAVWTRRHRFEFPTFLILVWALSLLAGWRVRFSALISVMIGLLLIPLWWQLAPWLVLPILCGCYFSLVKRPSDQGLFSSKTLRSLTLSVGMLATLGALVIVLTLLWVQPRRFRALANFNPAVAACPERWVAVGEVCWMPIEIRRDLYGWDWSDPSAPEAQLITWSRSREICRSMGEGFDLPSFADWRELTLSLARDPRNWWRDHQGFRVRKGREAQRQEGSPRTAVEKLENCHFPHGSENPICELFDLNYEWLADSPEPPSSSKALSQRQLITHLLGEEPKVPPEISQQLNCERDNCGWGSVRLLPRRPRSAFGGNRFDRREAGLFALMRTHSEGSASRDLGFRCIRRKQGVPLQVASGENGSSTRIAFETRAGTHRNSPLALSSAVKIFFTEAGNADRRWLTGIDERALASLVHLESLRNSRMQEVLTRRIFRSALTEAEIQKVQTYGFLIENRDGRKLQDYEWSNAALPIFPWRPANGHE